MKPSEFQGRVLDALDDIRKDITEIKITVAQQQLAIDQLQKDAEPVKKHVATINAVFKLGGGLAVLTGIVAGIIRIWSDLKG